MNENSPFRDNFIPNFDLIRMIGREVDGIQKYQSVPFKLLNETHKVAINFMHNFRFVEDEKILYRLSLKSEPSKWKNAPRMRQASVSAVEDSTIKLGSNNNINSNIPGTNNLLTSSNDSEDETSLEANSPDVHYMTQNLTF